jgi:NAD(P)-dependent dehydrogenase (short-subunit alcohol dehydrogenase family)
MTTFVISGAARGIGLEMTRQLIARGDEVFGLCRRASDDLRKSGARIIEGIDVTSDASMRELRAELGDSRIDVLVNNAGILTREGLDSLDFDAIRRQFEVNTLGPLRLTATCLGNLHKGSRIAIVSSRMGSIADNGSGGYYGYRASKAAVNSIGMCLARDLADRGIAVALLHPGMVSTDMTGHNGIPVSESASGLIARIDALDMSNTGTWWHANGEILPW